MILYLYTIRAGDYSACPTAVEFSSIWTSEFLISSFPSKCNIEVYSDD